LAFLLGDPPPSRSSCRFAQMRERASLSPAPAIGSLAGDILYGADAIAELMYGSKDCRRAIYNLIQSKSIPHFPIGTTVCARKSVLLAWIGDDVRRVGRG
jgi:hypothetical protein